MWEVTQLLFNMWRPQATRRCQAEPELRTVLEEAEAPEGLARVPEGAGNTGFVVSGLDAVLLGRVLGMRKLGDAFPSGVGQRDVQRCATPQRRVGPPKSRQEGVCAHKIASGITHCCRGDMKDFLLEQLQKLLGEVRMGMS